jgi:hypothetical protein
MVMRRDFLGGAGLLAGLFLSPPALAKETSRVTGRVALTQDESGDTWLEVWLTNHGPGVNDVRADDGHAVLADEVKVNGEAVWVMQQGMISRGGPRLEWKPLPVGKEVLAGRYWTETIEPSTDGRSQQQASDKRGLSGTVELTLRTGTLVLNVAEAPKKA